jgi:hypothetical protein
MIWVFLVAGATAILAAEADWGPGAGSREVEEHQE